MNNDRSDKLDELISRAAKDYNAPGAIPRDEMWNRIVEARRASVPASRSQRRPGLWIWPSAGIAAAALLVVGVNIGRRMERGSRAVVPPSRPEAVATTPDSRLPSAHTAPKSDDSTTPRPTSTAPAISPAPTTRPDAPDGAAIAYRMAVLDHVAGSEAMITAFRASARRGDVDAQVATWSRDLLGETRMLENAAPPDDVTMKRLLEDLELVIGQIVQYTSNGTHSAEDLDLIERSINHRALLPNLRTISAGRLPSGT